MDDKDQKNQINSVKVIRPKKKNIYMSKTTPPTKDNDSTRDQLQLFPTKHIAIKKRRNKKFRQSAPKEKVFI